MSARQRWERAEAQVSLVYGRNLERYADALIEIAAALAERPMCEGPGSDVLNVLCCSRCWEPVDLTCHPWCPGLLARRALGVA